MSKFELKDFSNIKFCGKEINKVQFNGKEVWAHQIQPPEPFESGYIWLCLPSTKIPNHDSYASQCVVEFENILGGSSIGEVFNSMISDNVSSGEWIAEGIFLVGKVNPQYLQNFIPSTNYISSTNMHIFPQIRNGFLEDTGLTFDEWRESISQEFHTGLEDSLYNYWDVNFRSAILNGREELDLPVLDPFIIPEATIRLYQENIPNDEFNVVNITIQNAVICGMSTFRVNFLSFNESTLEYQVELEIPAITLSGEHYIAEGELLGGSLPVWGEGQFEITYTNVTTPMVLFRA